MKKSKILVGSLLSLCVLSASVPVYAATAEDEWSAEITNDGATITGYNGSSLDIVIPEVYQGVPVTGIGDRAFKGKGLTSVVIPDTVTSIGYSAFESNKLKAISIPSKVDQMRAAVFNDNLLPDDQAFIYAPDDTSKLISYGGAKREMVQIPDQVTNIHVMSFMNTRLRSVFLPPSVTTIGTLAFLGCELTSITIPKSVKEIGMSPFNAELATIYMEGRTDTADMTLAEGWSGKAEIVYGGAGNVKQAVLSVTGNIDPITVLDIDVPISTSFLIDGNRDFKSAEISILNHSPVPVTVSALSMQAKTGTTAKLVSFDKYTADGWDNLNGEKTQHEIAIGLKLSGVNDLVNGAANGTQWFGVEGEQSILTLGTVKSGFNTAAPPRMGFSFDALYGKAWGNVSKLEYELVLSFEVVQ